MGKCMPVMERPNVVTETAVYPDPYPCLDRDGNRLPGAAMQAEAPNHRKLLFHNGNGGERYGRGLAMTRSGECNGDEQK